MPLERRVQPPRTYQRTRQQPYHVPSDLQYSPTEADNLNTIPRRNVEDRLQFPIAKRRRRGTCICTPCNEPMQTNDAYSNSILGDEAEETQMLRCGPWTQTDENRQAWRTDENTRLSSEIRTPASHSNALTPVRIEDSSLTGPNTTDSEPSPTAGSQLSSMIPSTVPTQNAPNRLLSCSEAIESLQSLSHSSLPNCDFEAVDQLGNSTAILRQPENDSEGLQHVEDGDRFCKHDRCAEERNVSPQLPYDAGRSPVPLRLFKRSMSAMPPPSAHACLVAKRVIRHACNNKTPHERFLWCPDCRRLPILPITGQCGHTRCTRCIQDHGACPCGVQAPKSLHVNTLIQDLIRKMLPLENNCSRETRRKNGNGHDLADRKRGSLSVRSQRPFPCNGPRSRRMVPDLPSSLLLSPQTRFEHARKLLAAGRHRDAAPHLARVAASSETPANIARVLLAQAISVMSEGRDPRRLTRDLYRAVRSQSAASWLKPSDLECVLCYHAYTSPVTTPCGHNYCRTCIERSMDYRKSCALCLRSLGDFDLASARETVFICAALASIDALNSPQPPEPDVIPIFVCTVAYPTIPCPLFIFDPRYWLMIRRVLESGSRKFGMVAYERDRTYSDYGTVLEVCDCVHLEDGRSILSTVGVSRFTVIERDVRDGCDVARIQPLTDITPTEELVIWELRIMATQISYKALLWLNSMNRTVRSEIEAAFGLLPHFNHQQEDWWESPDGPAWLWWLIAILPLRSEIKILILSTKNLLKRMMAVSRTLEAIDQVALSSSVSSECELRSALTAEEWL